MAEEEAARAAPGAARRGGLFEGAVVLAPVAVAALVANPGTEHVLQAQAVLESLPESFRRAARQPQQASALFVALAIDTAPEAASGNLPTYTSRYGGEHHDASRRMRAGGRADRGAAHAGAAAGVRGARASSGARNESSC